MIFYGSPYRFAAIGTAGNPTELAVPLSLAGSGSVTSAAYTPTASALQFVVAASRRASAPNPFSCLDSQGDPWTPLAQGTLDNGSNFLRLAIFRQRARGAPTSKTVTVGNTASTHLGAYVFEVAGATDDATNIAFDGDAAGSPAPSLFYPQSTGSVTLAIMAAVQSGASIPQPSGYTEIADWTGGTALRMEVAYRVNAPSQAVAWSTTMGLSIGALVEVKAI